MGLSNRRQQCIRVLAGLGFEREIWRERGCGIYRSLDVLYVLNHFHHQCC